MIHLWTLPLASPLHLVTSTFSANLRDDGMRICERPWSSTLGLDPGPGGIPSKGLQRWKCLGSSCLLLVTNHSSHNGFRNNCAVPHNSGGWCVFALLVSCRLTCGGGGGVLSSAGGPGGLGGPRWPHCRVCWLVLAVREAPPLSPSTRMGGVTAHPPFDLIGFLTWGSWHFKRQRQKLCHFLSLWP